MWLGQEGSHCWMVLGDIMSQRQERRSGRLGGGRVQGCRQERRREGPEQCKPVLRIVEFFLFVFFLKEFLYFYLFIYLFMAVLGLHFCARASSSCGERGPLFIAVRRPLTIAASLVAEHRLQTHRLSSCGSQA